MRGKRNKGSSTVSRNKSIESSKTKRDFDNNRVTTMMSKTTVRIPRRRIFNFTSEIGNNIGGNNPVKKDKPISKHVHWADELGQYELRPPRSRFPLTKINAFVYMRKNEKLEALKKQPNLILKKT